MNKTPQFQPFVPSIDIKHLINGEQTMVFLDRLTGWIFSYGMAIFFFAVLLSIIFFVLSGGNLRMVLRSRFWLELGVVVFTITGLIWAIFLIMERIFTSS